MARTWYIREKAGERGPMSADEVREALARGEIARDCWVWSEGLEDWVLIASEPNFARARH